MLKVTLYARMASRDGVWFNGRKELELPFAPYPGLYLTLTECVDYQCGSVSWDVVEERFSVNPGPDHWSGSMKIADKNELDDLAAGLRSAGFQESR